jgi:type I restriction enzyme S subunit
VRLKYLTTITTGDKDTVNSEESGAYPFFVRSQTVERISTYSFDGEAILTAGDGDIGKIFHHYVGKFDYHQRVYKFSHFKGVIGRFLFYYLSANLAHEVVKLSAKTTVDSLRMPMLENFKVIFPLEKEQTQIAKFLDYETARIDALIEKQQQLIALLKEKRQAVISHAVTKGLNPNTPMRDSGVEWLGEVPAHWEVVNLKRFISTRKGAPFKSSDFSDAGVPVVRASDIKHLGIRRSGVFLPASFVNYYPRAVLRSGELILSTVGSGPQVKNSAVGQIGRVPETLEGALLNQNTVVFAISDDSLQENFLFDLVQVNGYRDHLDLHAHGTANQASLNVVDMLNFSVAIPPSDEQLEVSAFVKDRCFKMDALEDLAVAQVELLQERRTAVISAAVTGKIDVRDWHPPRTQAEAA